MSNRMIVESVPYLPTRREISKAVQIEGFGSVDRSHLRPATSRERAMVQKALTDNANCCFDEFFNAFVVPAQEVSKSAPLDDEGNPANKVFNGLFQALFMEEDSA